MKSILLFILVMGGTGVGFLLALRCLVRWMEDEATKFHAKQDHQWIDEDER